MWGCIVRNTMSFSCRLLTLIYIANLFNNIFSPQPFKHVYTHTHTHTCTHTHIFSYTYTSLIKLRSITIIKCILFSYTVDSWKTWVWTMQAHLYAFLFSINTTSLQSLSWLNPWMQNLRYRRQTIKFYMDFWLHSVGMECGQCSGTLPCSRVYYIYINFYRTCLNVVFL